MKIALFWLKALYVASILGGVPTALAIAERIEVTLSPSSPDTLIVCAYNMMNIKRNVNFYIDGAYAGSALMEHRGFEKHLTGIQPTDLNLTVKVLEYYGPGKTNHLERSFPIPKHRQPHHRLFPHQIWAHPLHGDRLVIQGRGFEESRTYRINYYINGRWIKTDTSQGGRFQGSLRGVQAKDVIKVSVLDFYAPGEHKDVYLTASSRRSPKTSASGRLHPPIAHAPHVFVGALGAERSLIVRGSAFIVPGSILGDTRPHQIVRVLVNGAERHTIITTDGAFELSLNALREGDLIQVDLPHYFGQGRHFSQTFQASIVHVSYWRTLAGVLLATGLILVSGSVLV